MAVEARRRCGYRKVGGIYLRSAGAGMPCDRLPLPLLTCPCCSHGFKQTRGFTWVDTNLLVGGVHRDCGDSFPCPLCMATSEMGLCGLLWIGAQFYKTPAEFIEESNELGISRRLSVVPRDFKLGETWVLLAHPKGATCPACLGGGLELASLREPGAPAKCPTCSGAGKVPAVFQVFRPCAIEQIVTESQSRDLKFMAGLTKRNITAVIVPDDDRDHQGSVFDDESAPDSAAGGVQ